MSEMQANLWLACVACGGRMPLLCEGDDDDYSPLDASSAKWMEHHLRHSTHDARSRFVVRPRVLGGSDDVDWQAMFAEAMAQVIRVKHTPKAILVDQLKRSRERAASLQSRLDSVVTPADALEDVARLTALVWALGGRPNMTLEDAERQMDAVA